MQERWESFEVAERIKPNYEFFFQPHEVCDRIGFKDNKIFLIEIKRPKQELKPKQETFRKLVGEENYLVERNDK